MNQPVYLSNNILMRLTSTWQKLGLLLMANVLLIVSARLYVATQPVPITLQTFAVLFVATTLGGRLGSMAVLLYLLEGAVGLPVFAGASGIAVLFGPTGGYLFGFYAAALIMGALLRRGWSRTHWLSFCASVVGIFVILMCGFIVLSYFVGITAAFEYGVKPFLWIELVKIIALALIAPYAWKLP